MPQNGVENLHNSGPAADSDTTVMQIQQNCATYNENKKAADEANYGVHKSILKYDTQLRFAWQANVLEAIAQMLNPISTGTRLFKFQILSRRAPLTI